MSRSLLLTASGSETKDNPIQIGRILLPVEGNALSHCNSPEFAELFLEPGQRSMLRKERLTAVRVVSNHPP
jgi:hypothetical protein